MGLTAKQLVFSVASIVCDGGIVLLLYRYIGLTGSAYVACALRWEDIDFKKKEINVTKTLLYQKFEDVLYHMIFLLCLSGNTL